MSCPATNTYPLVGVSSPAMRLSSVLLPQPFGFMMDTNSPGGTSRLMSLTAATACAPRPVLTHPGDAICLGVINRGHRVCSERRGETTAATYSALMNTSRSMSVPDSKKLFLAFAVAGSADSQPTLWFCNRASGTA